jgi:hypothetical protein
MTSAVAGTILLCNRKHVECGKTHAYRESMHPLQNCQWCGQFCFAVAAISVDGFLLKVSSRDSRNHCKYNEGFVEGNFNLMFNLSFFE